MIICIPFLNLEYDDIPYDFDLSSDFEVDEGEEEKNESVLNS